VAGPQGLQGIQGLPGAQGPQGPQGPTGASGVSTSPASLADLNGVWTIYTLDQLSHQFGLCVLAFDGAGNINGGCSLYYSNVYGNIQLQGTSSISGLYALNTAGLASTYNMQLTWGAPFAGTVWSITTSLDRTHSTMSGLESSNAGGFSSVSAVRVY
jgi:hypothetical protein